MATKMTANQDAQDSWEKGIGFMKEGKYILYDDLCETGMKQYKNRRGANENQNEYYIYYVRINNK